MRADEGFDDGAALHLVVVLADDPVLGGDVGGMDRGARRVSEGEWVRPP